MNIELSVVIVNYNGFKYLEKCLQSLYLHLNDINFEIIIIDNNSKDESCLFIKQNFPEINLIESKINHGFGKGNNEAVKQAKGNYLLLINNDTIVLDNLKPVLNLLQSDNSIGVVGINMLNAQKKYLPPAGKFPNITNMFQLKNMFNLGEEFKTGIFSKNTYEVDWLGGSFLMLSHENYKKINGFDEGYFMYVEDVDFCKKLANINLKRVFLSTCSYVHFVGFDKKKNPMLIKGFKIYISKHCKGIYKIEMQFVLQINALVKKIKLLLNSK